MNHITNCGLPGIGAVPYGLHMCHFYPDREELLRVLVPYFQAGLRNNERCLWIAADPLPTDAIKSEIDKWPTLSDGLASGQLTILDALEWYGDPASLSAETIIARWLAEEQLALGNGYQGLRITGNTSFVPKDGWAGLMEYERTLNERLQEHRIVAFCSYSLKSCEAVDMLEVVHSHHAALDRSGEYWQLFTPPPRAREVPTHSNAASRASE